MKPKKDPRELTEKQMAKVVGGFTFQDLDHLQSAVIRPLESTEWRRARYRALRGTGNAHSQSNSSSSSSSSS